MLTSLEAQAPNWTAPNPADFSRSMDVVGVVNFEGTYSRSNQDQVGFFIDNELRGIGILTYLPNFGAEAYFNGTIFSNIASGEMVEVRVYYAADDQVYVANNPLDFVHTSVVGSFVTPHEFLIGNPVDEGISLLPIGTQLTLEDVSFEPIMLATLLVSTDNDPVVFSIDSLTPGVIWTLEGNMLRGTPEPGFVGESTVRIMATEQTNNALTAQRVVIYRTQPQVMGPNWHPIPAQIATLGDTFPDIDLAMNVDTLADSCYQFSYQPQLGQVQNEPSPNWMVNTTFQSTMTITARMQFTPNFTFDHPADQLAAFVNGEIRGVADPLMMNGEQIFFLSIGSDTGTPDTVRVRFYSGAQQRFFEYPPVITYQPLGQIGTAATPASLDFSNIIPIIQQDRRLEIAIQNPDSAAFASFEFMVTDCTFPNQIQDRITVPFCYGSPGTPLFLITLIDGPAEVCEVRTLDLATIVENVRTDGFTYTWDTSGDGDFLDANGDGDNRYEFATEYRPGPQDAANRRVTLRLDLSTGQMNDCAMELGNNVIEVEVKRVGSGSFPWGGD
ncbi:MAG: hypothetical protein AAF828_08350 [Bacteroidota bacterium]